MQVEVTETHPGSEAMARTIDFQKRKADPTYKGAFHEKKKKSSSKVKAQTLSSTDSLNVPVFCHKPFVVHDFHPPVAEGVEMDVKVEIEAASHKPLGLALSDAPFVLI